MGLREKALRYKPSPDKWCIWEILVHLVDAEILYAYRIRQMLADKDPVIAPIDPDAWAKNLGYLKFSTSGLVALYGLNRHANVRALRPLKVEDLQKSARHPKLDHRVTVGDYVGKTAKHGPNHLEQIERLKKEAAGK
ncbi:MAG: DinB family protein [Terriglobales bacterium]